MQIVQSSHRGSRDIEHIGSAHDAAEFELSKGVARRRSAGRSERVRPRSGLVCHVVCDHGVVHVGGNGRLGLGVDVAIRTRPAEVACVGRSQLCGVEQSAELVMVNGIIVSGVGVPALAAVTTTTTKAGPAPSTGARRSTS